MDISYEKPSGDTLRSFVEVFWNAFAPPEADMIMPMIYPRGLTEDLMQRLLKMMEDAIANDPRISFVLVKDHENGDLIGVSSWTVIESPLSTIEEIDAAYKAEQSDQNPTTVVEGVNDALQKAQSQAAFYAERTTMMTNKGNPYGVLKILAVNPKYHRRGVGSTMLREGLQRMDSQNLPVYLDAGVQAKPLYERFGFQVIKDYPLDARKYGGRSEGKHWCMLRPLQSTKA